MKIDEMGLEELDFEVKRLNFVIKRLRRQLTECKAQIDEALSEAVFISDCFFEAGLRKHSAQLSKLIKILRQPKGGK
jgi:hypothetical protein